MFNGQHKIPIGSHHSGCYKPVNHQDWNINFLEILPHVRLRKHGDAIIRIFETAHSTLLPPAPDLTLADCDAFTIEAEEWAGRDVNKEVGTILLHGGFVAIEDTLRAA